MRSGILLYIISMFFMGALVTALVHELPERVAKLTGKKAAQIERILNDTGE